MFLLKKLLTAFILPPFGLLLVALAGLALARRYPRGGRGMALLALSLLATLSLPDVGAWLTQSLEKDPPISPGSLASAQAIVILGGSASAPAPEFGVVVAASGTLERVRP